MDWEKLIVNNRHWEKDYNYKFPYRRKILSDLRANLDRSRLITLLIGPRRVGKTVIMKQLINSVLEKVERRNILYILLENENDNLFNIISMWAKELNIDLDKKTYVFFDEIQYINNWGRQIKFIYDSYPHMKLFLSGSASALLRKGSESLAGRMVERYIGPLDFEEYLMFSKKIKPRSHKELWKYYKEYLFKQLPDIAMGEDPKEYMDSIINKIIAEDLKTLFDAPDQELAKSILRIVLKMPGQIIDYTDLASELGVNRATISKYINAFCDSFIFRKVYNFSKNPRKIEKRKKKFYPYYTTLINYIKPFIPDEGYLLETDIFEKLNAKYYYRERGKEIDLILPKCMYGIEIKTGKKITKSMIKTLLNTKWLKKRIIICPPNSQILAENAEVYFPHQVVNILQDCYKQLI